MADGLTEGDDDFSWALPCCIECDLPIDDKDEARAEIIKLWPKPSSRGSGCCNAGFFNADGDSLCCDWVCSLSKGHSTSVPHVAYAGADEPLAVWYDA